MEYPGRGYGVKSTRMGKGVPTKGRNCPFSRCLQAQKPRRGGAGNESEGCPPVPLHAFTFLPKITFCELVDL